MALPIDILYAPEDGALAQRPPAQEHRGQAVPFDLKPFIGFRLGGPGRRAEEVRVHIGGKPLLMPELAWDFDADAALTTPGCGLDGSRLVDFVEAAYLFGGWLRVQNIGWQVKWIAAATLNARDCAEALLREPPLPWTVEAMVGAKDARWLAPPLERPHPGSSRQWAFALALYLQQSVTASMDIAVNPDRRTAAHKYLVRLQKAYEAETARLRARILEELQIVESQAQAIALEQLADSKKLILSEGWRLLGMIQDATFEEWSERHMEGAIRYSPKTERFNDLLATIKILAKPAEKVLEADYALAEEIFGESMKAIPRSLQRGQITGIPGVELPLAATLWIAEIYLIQRSARVQLLRTKLAEAQQELAAMLAPATYRFPILFRFSPSQLSDASVLEPGIVAQDVYLKLKAALEATVAMKELLGKSQPISGARLEDLGTLQSSPTIELAKSWEGSVWAYRKTIQQAADSLYLGPETLGAAAVKEMLEAIEEQKRKEEQVATAVSVAQTGLTLGLTIVCPPAGLALDLAFGVTDAVMAANVYETQSNEYYCTLDPEDSFADVEPSMLPVVLAVGGVVLSAVFP